jgi:hypothetical protein
MSKLLRLNALVPLWLAALGFVAVLLSPMTFATAGLLLMVGLVMPTVVTLLWKDQPATVAEVLNGVERPRTR